jgi:hypothetical protein
MIDRVDTIEYAPPVDVSPSPRLETALDQISQLWEVSSKVGYVVPMVNNGGLTSSQVLRVDAPGHVGRVYGESLFVSYDKPNVLHFMESRSGGMKLQGRRSSTSAEYNLDTGDFEFAVSDINKDYFSDGKGKEHFRTITIKRRIKGNRNLGVTQLVRSVVVKLNNNVPTPEDVFICEKGDGSAKTDSELRFATDEVGGKIELFLDNWSRN